jgi:UDP-glucose 4-epimerase
MSRTIVLGHTGFLGGALMSYLQAEGKSEVLGFSSKTVDLRRNESLKVLEDVVDAGTTVIFASAITREKGDNIETLLDNIAMAGRLAAFLEAHPPAKCVCFSSDAVYPMQGDPITEETPVAPGGTYYAIAKYTAECVLRRSAVATRIPLLVLRPTGVFGPGDTHNSYGPNAFVRAVLGDRTVRLFGDGEEQRDHLYIGDLVRLVSRLIETNAVGVYNLANGISRSFAEIVEALRRVAPVEFTVSRSRRSGPVTHRTFDISRLSSQLPGFQFTSPEQALQETFRHLSVPLEA